MIIGATRTSAPAKHNSASAGQVGSYKKTMADSIGYITSGMDAAQPKGTLPEGTSVMHPIPDILHALSSKFNGELAGILKEAGIRPDPPFDIKRITTQTQLESRVTEATLTGSPIS